jgi:hypothetical protein
MVYSVTLLTSAGLLILAAESVLHAGRKAIVVTNISKTDKGLNLCFIKHLRS